MRPRVLALAGMLAVSPTAGAHAQVAPTRRPPVVAPSSLEESHDLRAHFGIDMAQRLARSGDPEDRVRAIVRAASTARKEEAVTFLVGLADSGSAARNDGRALIELSLALARLLPHEKAARALLAIVNMPAGRGVATQGSPAEADTDNTGRIDLARGVAALALARSGDARSIEGLSVAARAGSPGQPAARRALLARPPVAQVSHGTSSAFLASYPELGDLRTLEPLRAAARSSDAAVRSLALVALARMGDSRAVEAAKAALSEADARVKIAGAEALAILDSGDAAKAVLDLFEDEATSASAIRLSARVSNEAIVTQVAARAARHPDLALRKAAILALARSREMLAVRSLLTLAQDPTVQADAVFALGRSAGRAAMTAIEQLMTRPPGIAAGEQEALVKRHAARAYLVRAVVRGERSARAETALVALRSSGDVRDREVATLARVALGLEEVGAPLADKEPRIRRAALMGRHALGPAAAGAQVLGLAGHDEDRLVRELAMFAIAQDPGAPLPITLAALEARAGSAQPASPIAAMMFAARAGDAQAEKVWKLLASRTPLVREHVARGLGRSENPQATGRLCAAFRHEPDADVRRAIVAALATRAEASPWLGETLENASLWDPDEGTRTLAARAIARQPPLGPPATREVAWFSAAGVVDPGGPSALAGSVRRADGVAVPVSFDGDGFMVLPGIPPGDVELVLELRLR